MMHIVLLIPSHWAEALGGAEYQVKVLKDHLLDTGRFRVTWVSRRVSNSYTPENYDVRQVSEHRGLRTRGFFFDSAPLTAILEELKPDVIYQRVGCAYTGIAAKYARSSGCRMVWHVASEADVTPAKRWSMRDLLLPFKPIEKRQLEYGIRHVPKIVVQTKHQAATLLRNYNRTADAVIGNFHPLPNEVLNKNGPKQILWIANLKAIKNPLAFVSLAEKLQHLKDVRFLMIGDAAINDKFFEEIERRTAGIGSFTFVGRQTQTQVNVLLAKSHLLINTSFSEGFSNTFIQAWMRKVPVLSLHADPDELLMREGLGYCTNGDEESLARIAADLITNDAERSAIGERAYAYAIEKHSERNVQSLIELLEG